jgi:hypothetical protein
LPFFEINQRFQAKMDIYNRLAIVVVPIFRDDQAPELQRTRDSLEQIVARIGGELEYYAVNAPLEAAKAIESGP